MKRRHRMPFGAEFRDDGGVRFCLWAPAAKQVGVCIDDRESPIFLNRQDDGWFELVTDEAKQGSQYYFQIDNGQKVPDPASRFQPKDVHGPSEVIDPAAFEWRDQAWRGRKWEEAVIYELHTGAFTESGKFAGIRDRLDYLVDLGITAIELMPISDFPGKRNWGYDGVFPFAPDSSYGRPEDLKDLVQNAHDRGLMVFLDVVYNHFGPEGNYLGAYARDFFTDRHRTPWGNGINFDGPGSRSVRDFFIHNALYWLTEYHFDGLRLDAVNTIVDDSKQHILTELAEVVRTTISADRDIHLILENELNQASRLRRTDECRPQTYTAQWNDDIHHALHVLTTGERAGYYSDYAKQPIDQLGRCLASGFAYQGDVSLFRKGAIRGEDSTDLPPGAFISFLQNHDQIGNRAFGERIVKIADHRAVRAATAILLLAPSPPMLFMGEEFGAETPFLFFCDFEKELAAAVTAGRRNEFAHFPAFNDPTARERIPDPEAAKTFENSRLRWDVLEQPRHQEWLSFYRRLLQIRQQHVLPRLTAGCALAADYKLHGDRGLSATWKFPDHARLSLIANLGDAALSIPVFPASQIIFASVDADYGQSGSEMLPPWSVVWTLQT